MSSLRVIHVASGREWRGGQRQVFLLARAMARRNDLETLVITGRDTPLAVRLEVAGVQLHPVSWGPGLDPRVTLAVLREIRRGAIVHVHDNHAHLLADVATHLRRAPVVANRRITLPITSPKRYRRAAGVIAISEAVRAQLIDAGCDADRIHLIPDAIDLHAAAEWRPWPEQLPAPPAETPLIACVAALTPEKGLGVLLEAAALLHTTHPKARWIVLGEGSERERLMHQRAALALDEVVAFPGHIESPEAVLSRAAVVVQPSLSEGFGSSVLDALAVGVPVVASAAGGLPEALSGGGGRLVPPGDAKRLAEEVGQLLADPEARAALSAAARSGVRRFSISRLVDRTLDVYRSIMKMPAQA